MSIALAMWSHIWQHGLLRVICSRAAAVYNCIHEWHHHCCPFYMHGIMAGI